jgi:cbb3-type cytochrome c oxidase subunit III
VKRKLSAGVTAAFAAMLGVTLFAAACSEKTSPPNTEPSNTKKETNANTAATNAANANATTPAAMGPLEGEQLANAKTLFKANCSECHLDTGKGSAEHKHHDIPDFTNATWHAKESDDDLVKVVKNGKDDNMPAFGEEISEADIKLLVRYVRSLSAK